MDFVDRWGKWAAFIVSLITVVTALFAYIGFPPYQTVSAAEEDQRTLTAALQSQSVKVSGLENEVTSLGTYILEEKEVRINKDLAEKTLTVEKKVKLERDLKKVTSELDRRPK